MKPHGAHSLFIMRHSRECSNSGADIVIQSLVMKTLPAFTQTGLLHLCNNSGSQERNDAKRNCQYFRAAAHPMC